MAIKLQKLRCKIYKSFNLDESLKAKSYPYYFCLLILPKHSRASVALLWGLAAEIRFIPLSVTNPLAGFMRLTSWRDWLLAQSMTQAIDWLNTYEVFFDETTTIQENWPTYIKGEALLLSQSLFMVQKDPTSAMVEAATLLGEVMGLIYLLQSERKFGLAADMLFKKNMVKQIEDRLFYLKSIYPVPKNCRGLFSLIGYCKAWLRRYCVTYQPVTLTEPVIQWAVLKQRMLNSI